MASIKDIKNRINSIKDTKKITNAMYLIASTKTRKSKSELDKTRPYFEACKSEIKRLFRIDADIESEYFYPPKGEKPLDGKNAYLIITADKGLAGAYNQNIIKESLKLIENEKDFDLYVVGEYGRRFFTNHNIKIERSFLYTAQNPTLERAREIRDILLDGFLANKYDKIFIVYTDFGNGVEEKVCTTRLLPFHRRDFAVATEEKTVKTPFEFEPNIKQVLNNTVHTYIAGFIYSALVDSFCSEQNARMTAMDNANRNADKLLSELTLKYNHERQSAITNEITEISAGAAAMRKLRKKRKEKEQAL